MYECICVYAVFFVWMQCLFTNYVSVHELSDTPVAHSYE